MSVESSITSALVLTAELGIEDIKAQMVELDMNVSLKTTNSLKTNLVSPSKIEIIAEQSILTLVFGRKPGKMPLVDEIEKWAKARGLPDGIEWGIAINISKFGTAIFQGKRKGIDIDRVNKKMTDFFKVKVQELVAKELTTIVINLYR